MSKPKDVDDVVKGMGREIVEREIKNGDQELTPIETVHPGLDEEERVADAFSHVPADEGFYVKIYRKYPVPKEFGNHPMFLLDITQPDLIQDYEAELLKLAKQYGWCSGVYEIKLFQRGTPGVRASRRITLEVPQLQTPSPQNQGQPQGQTDPTAAITQAVKLIKEIYPGQPSSAQNIDPVALLRAIAEAYKTGAESAKAVAPVSEKKESIVDVAKAIRELAPPSAPQSSLDPAKLLDLAKELGALRSQSPQVDPIDYVIKLKQAGLIPEPKAETDQTTKVIELVTALAPLLSRGEGSGEPASPVVELIRALAPQASKIVSDITNAINNVALTRAGAKPKIVLPPPGGSPNRELGPAQIAQVSEEPMLPIFKAIKVAAERNDQAFFPQMEQLLIQFAGEEQYDQILAGTIPPEQVLDQVSVYGGSWFKSPTAKLYLESFIIWAKAKQANAVVGRCTQCSAEFEFESKEEFEKDSKCPECQGQLQLV